MALRAVLDESPEGIGLEDASGIDGIIGADGMEASMILKIGPDAENTILAFHDAAIAVPLLFQRLHGDQDQRGHSGRLHRGNPESRTDLGREILSNVVYGVEWEEFGKRLEKSAAEDAKMSDQDWEAILSSVPEVDLDDEDDEKSETTVAFSIKGADPEKARTLPIHT